ncbi:hypothetical protein OG601_08540 [Streptomyces sp. NBC_01239]|uniref:helix-turn-helix domain-containing protein n=1 Tax=Streptomyces sp. NBC_01239 TaxID=2903792 RepID=UPI00224E23D6|nr:helix-turn-helix domain-containing protein [Streptomyces sp. NBC_01239]MCX4810668.1 hypothetical protein [Streptomyces sp. NBC_01239]
MFSPDAWREVRRLHAGGMPIKQIARHQQMAPNTVRRLLRCEQPPRYQRPERLSVAEPFEPLILQLLRAEPGVSAAEIARRIDWPASASLLRFHVARLRATLPPQVDPRPEQEQGFRSTVLRDFLPGWAECGLWWPPAELDVGYGQTRRCPVLLMVAGASRHMSACLLPSARFRNVWIGQRRLLQEWGAVPHTLRWDTSGIDFPWSWYFQTEGWDISWNTYVARAELDDLAVQDRGRPPSGLAAARRRLRQSSSASPLPAAPLTFAADLTSWVAEANEAARSGPTRWTEERAAMRAPATVPQLLATQCQCQGQGRAVPDADGYIAVAGTTIWWARGARDAD